MKKFVEWFNRSRKPVGYTIGSLNVLLGLSYALEGLTGMAVLWVIIGGWIIYDTYEFK